jgi:LysR family transcriptional regulator (chromosome initiation inhibitor)
MLERSQLKALEAVVEAGSFEGAAVRLGLTQSAVSQRIKALEDQLGASVIVRGQPCVATDIGARLVRHGQDVALIEQATLREIGHDDETIGRPTVRIALNADSLATWVMPALAMMPDVLFDIVIDDQDHAAGWLRTGQVAAAISSRAEPVQGCDAFPLGALCYIATASPAFVAMHFPRGLTEEALRAAPSLAFDAKDKLQMQFVEREIGKRVALPVHRIASTQSFVEATKLGLGWGLNPKLLVDGLIFDGSLVALSPRPFATPLYWQVSRLVAKPLTPLTNAMREAARQGLDPEA